MNFKKIVLLIILFLTSCNSANISVSKIDKLSTSSISNNVNSIVTNSNEISSSIKTSSKDKLSSSVLESGFSSNIFSSTSSLIKEKLDTPTNVSVDGQYYLNWSVVENATSYLVYINDVDVEVKQNKLDVFDLLIAGVRNTLSIQAIDTTGKYLDSDTYSFIYDDGGPYEGITIVDKNSYVANLKIKEENNQKIIEIPYDEIAKDATGSTPDVTLTFDYDDSKFKFYYESNDSILYIAKQNGKSNIVEISFNDIGEITLNVVKFGNDHGYIFDSITIKVVRNENSGFSKFEIAYYNFNEIDNSITIVETDSYTIGCTPMDYAWLTIVVGENDEIIDPMNTVTWQIISGDALDFSYAYGLDVYYVGKNKIGTVIIQATSCYGDVDTFTINVTVPVVE